MQNFRIIDGKTISSHLKMADVIKGVEDAYMLKCDNKAMLFPLVCHSFDDGYEEFDIKSGTADGAGIFGMKLVSAFSRNDEKGLPRLTGTILIFDRSTGMLKAIMDGGHITNMRTGAAGGIGCKALARPESESILLVGTGAQATPLLDASLTVMENIKTIYIHNPKTIEKSHIFAQEYKAHIAQMFPMLKDKLTIKGIESLQEACGYADIILTATPSRVGLIKTQWIKEGTHLSCIGSDMEGKQELEISLLGKAKVFCDDLNQVIAVGECEKAVKNNILLAKNITEIGDVLLGKKSGRTNEKEITIFDSTGIGLQDLMVAKVITDLAEKEGFGVEMSL